MKLTLNIEDEISFLDRYGLTPNELLAMRCLLILQDEDESDTFQHLLTVYKRVGINFRDILLCLQDKGIILKAYDIPKENAEFDPYAIPINKNIIKNLYRCSFELGKELFDAYPQFTSINNTIVPLRGVSKKFDSLEQAYFKYGKAIGWSLERHNEIIDLIKWAEDKNIINCTLASFIIDRRWEDLAALKDGDIANVNYDAIKML